jgi:hypothetical protein
MLTLYIIINIFWLMVWFSLVRREIGLTFLQMMKDIVPYITVALVAVGAASLTAFSIPNIYLSLLIKVVVATAVYCLALWSLHSVIFREAINFFLKKKIG